MTIKRLPTQIRLQVESEIARQDIRDRAMFGYDDARRLWWMAYVDSTGEIVRTRCKRMSRQRYEARLEAVEQIAELRPGYPAPRLN